MSFLIVGDGRTGQVCHNYKSCFPLRTPTECTSGNREGAARPAPRPMATPLCFYKVLRRQNLSVVWQHEQLSRVESSRVGSRDEGDEHPASAAVACHFHGVFLQRRPATPHPPGPRPLLRARRLQGNHLIAMHTRTYTPGDLTGPDGCLFVANNDLAVHGGHHKSQLALSLVLSLG